MQTTPRASVRGFFIGETLTPRKDPADIQKVGRKSMYRESYCDEVINMMASGYSLTAAMASLGFTRSRAHEWAAIHPEFQDAIALGHAKRSMKLEELGLAAASGPQVTFVMKALANCNVEDFRERKEVEHTHNVKPAELSDDDLASIAAGSRAGTTPAKGNPRVVN